MGKVGVLFVCTGNICRSPMAEAVFVDLVSSRGLESLIAVDSAGTGSWHVGDSPDPRAIHELTCQGHTWKSKARQVRLEDFQDFDYIVGLDQSHVRDLQRFCPSQMAKVTLLMNWAGEPSTDVPDPYYGGDDGFRKVYAMVHRGCSSLLDHIAAQLNF